MPSISRLSIHIRLFLPTANAGYTAPSCNRSQRNVEKDLPVECRGGLISEADGHGFYGLFFIRLLV